MRPNWFLALPVPADGWFPERLPPPPIGVRLFAPEDLHCTLAFLGAVEAEDARRAFAVLRECWPTETYELRLGRGRLLGVSALALLFHPEDRAPLEAAIAAHRPACLAAAGVRPEDRPPLAHSTLGRYSRRAPGPGRRAAREWIHSVDLASMRLRLGPPALYTWAKNRRERLFRRVDGIER